MQLYFSPLACSLASRIACYEAGAEIAFIEVDPKTKRTLDGQDYKRVYPLALVPALVRDDGRVLTENAAILQFLAASYPAARLGGDELSGRAELQRWLSFVSTELHKALFVPLLDAEAPEAVKSYALRKGSSRLDYLDAHLAGREFLLDHFSVADAYLIAVLNWTAVTPIDLAGWPNLKEYLVRMRKRPNVARAMQEERGLYAEELARHGQKPPTALTARDAAPTAT